MREYCPVIIQSHMGIEIQTLGKYLCTGHLQEIQLFSSTLEDEVTARGKLTTDLVMVTLASITLASEQLSHDFKFTVTSIVKTIMGQWYRLDSHISRYLDIF